MQFEEREAHLRHLEHCYNEMKYKLETENASLKAELSAAQKDAKRYRWLREHLNDTDSLADLWPEGAEKTPTPDELDNAIDKALGE